MKKRIIKPRFKFLLLAGLLVYVGITIYGQQLKITELRQKQEALNSAVIEAETEYSRLRHKSEYMNTTKYVENTAREKFGLAYEEELIIEPMNTQE